MTTFVPVRNTATAGENRLVRGLIFAFDGVGWRDYPWGVEQQHPDGGGWVDVDVMVGTVCDTYAEAREALKRAGLYLPSGSSASGLSIRIVACDGRPAVHYHTDDSDRLAPFVASLFAGARRVVILRVPEAVVLEREAACNACHQFVGGYTHAQYRCGAKVGCTRLHIEHAAEACPAELWPLLRPATPLRPL